ncbi:fimbrillin family protein, partial [uncultured Prevotella sp.]|uniref:fimbrillin family protein n=1 Tax=uncultured Prevotella sp. TaxID=159272 RepID=UPI00259AAB2B
MKSTTKYLSLAALALMGALASCQSDDDFTVARPDNAVSVNFSVGSLQATTRSNAIATDDTQREFNQGDQISVSTNDQEAVLFQCTSTDDQTWTEAVPNKFLLWTQPTLTFSAYYPVTTGTSMTAFTVPADQSSVEKIALADYMTRQQVISRPEGGSDIQMQLERKMARVIVRISGFGSQYFDDQKTVSNVRIYSEASGIADGNPTGSSTEIQPYAQGDGGQGSTYTALVVPGYGDSGARFIQLSDGEGSTLLVKGIPELEAGNSYTFNLVVGKNKIEVASVTVQDWTTGETLSGGQAEEQLGVKVTAITLNKTATTIPAGQTETLSVSSVTP